eukprot:TRINITY_DN3985_c0_g2_i1.p1 TRINITY_DN3985_c0_g2~~TRINITY_DN3985_c0_g2_i1.p1  ORF type:complete len:542 (-),score=51.02 TRINITY_DN3985_c0_g2_i1:709-2334(-)
MIDYEVDHWGVGLICSLTGSVFPRALAWAVPAAFLAAVYCSAAQWHWGGTTNYPDVGGTSFTLVWGGYTFIVGFLLVFRTQIAFARFWEGATTLFGVKGVWVNAVSNMLAFTTHDAKKQGEVDAFQHYLVRLMSMLFAASLESISTASNEFPTLGDLDIPQEYMDYLAHTHDKVEVLLNWIQRLIVQNHNNHVLAVPPPILSRVFQELGNGIRDLQNARRLQQYHFPFPYAQAITFFLIMNWLFIPAIAGFFIPQPIAASLLTFITTFAVWSINYIACELEMPFGEDPNDLPLLDMQKDFNQCMRMLMHPMARVPPCFAYQPDKHEEMWQQEHHTGKPVYTFDPAKHAKNEQMWRQQQQHPQSNGEASAPAAALMHPAVKGRARTNGGLQVAVNSLAQSQNPTAGCPSGGSPRGHNCHNGAAAAADQMVLEFPSTAFLLADGVHGARPLTVEVANPSEGTTTTKCLEVLDERCAMPALGGRSIHPDWSAGDQYAVPVAIDGSLQGHRWQPSTQHNAGGGDAMGTPSNEWADVSMAKRLPEV